MNDNKIQERLTYVLIGCVLFIFLWLCIITGFMVGVCQDVLTLTAETETVPETEEVIETTESETAPVETAPTITIIPEIEETIPTEPATVIPETIEPPVIEETEPEIDPHDVELLACVIYQEAGADYICDECRRRVADVVLNRVEDPKFPDTIRGVLTAPGQYGNFSVTGVVWPERASYPGEVHAVRRAYRIAREVLSGQHSDLYGKGYIWQATFIQGKDNVYCCGHYYGR